MTGQKIGNPIVIPTDEPTALAFDPLDQSLWFFDERTVNTTETFYQYSSTTGLLLSSQSHPAALGKGIDYRGGEFDMAVTSTPEPASLSLIAIELVGLGGSARMRKRRAGPS